MMGFGGGVKGVLMTVGESDGVSPVDVVGVGAGTTAPELTARL